MKKFLTSLMLFGLLFTVQAQQHELGVFAGGSYYVGDLNPYWHFIQSKPAAGILYRYNINYRMAIRVHGLFGSLNAADSVTLSNADRNLSFRSPVMEFGTQFEVSYRKFRIGSDNDRFSPYLFLGASFFKFKPEGYFNGDWYSLQALGTEGQGTTMYPNRKPYSLAGLSIPFGMGIKWSPAGSVVLGLEWGLRKTFTDYIDDVSTTYADPSVLASQNTALSAEMADRSGNPSVEKAGFQRGNPSTDDWYSFFGLTITFKIKDKGDHCPGATRRRGSHIRDYFRILKNEPPVSF